MSAPCCCPRLPPIWRLAACGPGPPHWSGLPASLPTPLYSPLWLAASHRSEEHTSELQSLMRISYAVFCLKKKKQQITHHIRSSNKHDRDNQTTRIEQTGR